MRRRAHRKAVLDTSGDHWLAVAQFGVRVCAAHRRRCARVDARRAYARAHQSRARRTAADGILARRARRASRAVVDGAARRARAARVQCGARRSRAPAGASCAAALARPRARTDPLACHRPGQRAARRPLLVRVCGAKRQFPARARGRGPRASARGACERLRAQRLAPGRSASCMVVRRPRARARARRAGARRRLRLRGVGARCERGAIRRRSRARRRLPRRNGCARGSQQAAGRRAQRFPRRGARTPGRRPCARERAHRCLHDGRSVGDRTLFHHAMAARPCAHRDRAWSASPGGRGADGGPRARGELLLAIPALLGARRTDVAAHPRAAPAGRCRRPAKCADTGAPARLSQHGPMVGSRGDRRHRERLRATSSTIGARSRRSSRARPKNDARSYVALFRGGRVGARRAARRRPRCARRWSLPPHASPSAPPRIRRRGAPRSRCRTRGKRRIRTHPAKRGTSSTGTSIRRRRRRRFISRPSPSRRTFTSTANSSRRSVRSERAGRAATSSRS